MFHDRSLHERCFLGFVLPCWSTVLQCNARLPIHTLNYWTVQSVVPGYKLRVYLSVTLLIVDLLQFCVCCIQCTRSGVTRCTRLMMRFLDRMCQCRLQAVPWSHIGILMRRLAAEPRSTTRLSFPSQCPSGTILRTSIRWCGTGGFQEQGPCSFIGLSCSIPIL